MNENNLVNKEEVQKTTKKTRGQNSKLVIILILSLVILLLGGLVIKNILDNTNGYYVRNYQVCNADVVKKFNSMFNTNPQNTDGLTLESVVNEFINNKDYEKDATCQYIMYAFYSNKKDYKKTQEVINKLSELSNAGAVVDLNIQNLYPLSILEGALEFNERNPAQEGM